ncbi:sigma-70 family RNA polymerase sigma factor [Clostridium perfringens]|uniref:RNA polymerase sigma factor n=1 Tax=Clostridium perfringens TaxID=1502 RepID=UPI002246B4C9|nr:sigma-70 family RNA polymerase sigma factor [Clostridium perfringens]MCX0365309.1 sigma-70 family RNA polymerase sigma factor [Clostridium perfringens]MCX0374822.1 sigma-70 family RNA polymerase sigma factor [Clostridium perfringens]MCX0395552.1 sigma-70 family RNA polymerase sigma factor [Clostridium perfringens]MCX0402098.1 sigma-70 family RNA polymerase sigma factor [Clostridium perfringens]MDU1308759.1 sigma-70 family RNA polymerase sigma factor [Clostridium perfringens]
MNSLRENEIILQIKENNFENFDILYNKYYKRVFFLALKMIGDEKLAEDIAQEVFIDVISSIKNLNNIEIFNAWISKITINKVNTKRKKLFLYKKKVANCESETFENIINENFIPEELILKEEMNKEILEQINKLSPNKRRVLLLYYFKEMSLKEISVIENIPIGTVKSRLYSAKRLLKNLIKINTNIVVIALIFSMLGSIISGRINIQDNSTIVLLKENI